MQPVSEYLKTLDGLSPDEIAAKFLAEGIRGKRAQDDCCPLANAIKKHTGCDVCVCHFDVVTDTGSIVLSDDLRQFVRSVDERLYPDLLEKW